MEEIYTERTKRSRDSKLPENMNHLTYEQRMEIRNERKTFKRERTTTKREVKADAKTKPEENSRIHRIELGPRSLKAEVCLNSEFPELDEKYTALF